MRRLHKNLLAIFVALLISPPLSAEENITPNKNEAIIVVHGIVCSFCAQGVTRKLSKLPFIDDSKYTKGVKVEIESQKVTIAIEPGKEADFDQVFKAIKSGGYEPVKAYSDDGKTLTPKDE